VEGYGEDREIPFGCAKRPFSTPDLIARLNCASKDEPVPTDLLFATTYFFRASRLEKRAHVSKDPSRI